MHIHRSPLALLLVTLSLLLVPHLAFAQDSTPAALTASPRDARLAVASGRIGGGVGLIAAGVVFEAALAAPLAWLAVQVDARDAYASALVGAIGLASIITGIVEIVAGIGDYRSAATGDSGPRTAALRRRAAAPRLVWSFGAAATPLVGAGITLRF